MSQLSNPVTVNGTDLNTVSGLTVLATNPYHPPRRHLVIADIAKSHKSVHSSAYYNERLISIRVGITRATRSLVEASLDSLLSLVQGINKTLVLPQAGGSRQYSATYSDYDINVEGGSYLELSLIFTCTDRFGYDTAPTQLLTVTGFSSQSRSDPLAFGGSAPTQVPVIRITYSALTSGTGKYVEVGNGATGQVVRVTRTWTAGDFLEIDTSVPSVKVNNIDVAITGAIPEWLSSTGYWSYFDNLGSRTFSASIYYYKRYAS